MAANKAAAYSSDLTSLQILLCLGFISYVYGKYISIKEGTFKDKCLHAIYFI